MHMYSVAGDSCQEPFQHSKLNAIIWNVITSTQQLHRLSL